MQSHMNGNKGQMTALVKGAGPSGLAAAVALAQEGFKVTVAEKRAFRPPGQGRKNMVALRPEALHQLELLGGLDDAHSKNSLTPITKAATHNEWDDSTFVWPLDTQPRYGLQKDYTPPGKIDDQVPSSFINLGHLEDHLTKAAERLGVDIRHSLTFSLEPSNDGSDCFTVKWDHTSCNEANGMTRTDKSVPSFPSLSSTYDLIVCASGKGDLALEKSLSFKRHVGVKLEEENLPEPGSRRLRLGPEHEIETQRYLVFGVLSSAQAGTLGHEVRKKDTGAPEQPVVEIEMRHAAASHYILQIPRGFRETPEALDAYATQRVNARQGSSFANVSHMLREGAIVWGDPLTPVRVETSTAPAFVFGSNVVLVGDAGMSCSPTAGLGADVGMTHDVQAIRQLAQDLQEAKLQAQKQVESGTKGAAVAVTGSGGIFLTEPWQKALDTFNLKKAKGAVMWSQGSRWFYVTNDKANEILASVKELEVSA